MKFCQDMLLETVGLLDSKKLPYPDSILIGENAAGKSEALKRFMKETSRMLYFIDAVNRSLDIRAVKTLGEDLQYKSSIFVIILGWVFLFILLKPRKFNMIQGISEEYQMVIRRLYVFF